MAVLLASEDDTLLTTETGGWLATEERRAATVPRGLSISPDSRTLDAAGAMTYHAIQDPQAELDRTFDWNRWLADDEHLVSADVTATGDVTVTRTVVHAGSVVAWLAGGTPGADAVVTCTVTTNQARTDQRSLTLHIRDR